MTKLEKLREEMDGCVDAIILFDEINQHYISDFKSSDGAILVTKENAYFITDFRYLEASKKVLSDEFQIEMPKNRIDFIADVLEKEKCKLLGVEDKSISYSKYLELQTRLEKVRLCGASRIIELLRSVKSERELEKIKKAQAITDAAFSHILNMLSFGMTEIDVALELEFFMRKNGAEGIAFDTISVSGDASALPHGTPRNVKLQRGFLTMDFGAKYDGYCSDMTRTVSIGKATDEMKDIYNTVLGAQQLALEAIKAGVDCFDLDKIARDHINSGNYKMSFGHSLGHGVGMYIHEYPRVAPVRDEISLVCGNVITVEPGIYLKGKYGCRIEDMGVVLEDGFDNFTRSTKELVEIY